MKGNQIWTLKIESEALTEEVESIARGFRNVLEEFESLSNIVTTFSNNIENNASSIESLSNTLEGISNGVYTDIDTLRVDLSSLSNSVIDSASKITELQEANRTFTDNDVVLSSNLTVVGNFVTSDSATFESNVSIEGLLSVEDDVTLDSNLVVHGTATVHGSTSLQSNLEVNGAAIFDSNVGIGIGLSNVQNKLHVGGSIRATGNIIAEETVVSESDVRLKNNITPILNPYDIVKGMNGVLYSLKRDQVEPVKRYCGLIAQDVQKVLPEVVETQSDGTLSVAYGNIVGVVVEAVKNLIEEVEELKGKK